MARMIVFVVDVVNDDPSLDTQSYKRGHVVSIYDDAVRLESYPGIAEQLGHTWQIIEVPGVEKDDLAHFLGGEIAEGRRAVTFDLDSYSGGPLDLSGAMELGRSNACAFGGDESAA